MANYLNKMVSDDFVWTTINSALTGRKKRANTGFININCPMCVTRGHNPDTRMRCGVKNNIPGVGIHCFNCGFDTKWVPGDILGKNIREFMVNIGVPEIEVKRINHRTLVYRNLVEKNPEAQSQIASNFSLEFPKRKLPKGAKSFDALAQSGCDDPNFLAAARYIMGRGEDVFSSTSFYWTPETENNMNRRVIIPFLRHDEIVGWTGRIIDHGDTKTEKKYFNQTPLDFIFNNHVMEIKERKFIIVVEGVIDALAIDGVSTCGARLSDKQAAWIDSMGKTVIMVPDHDKSGDRTIDMALKRGWHVSMPLVTSGSAFNWWHPDIKDVADAVRRYGRLYTLTSIIKSATADQTAINVKRKMVKRSFA